ncbi:MAG: hypothetical protein NVS2B14_02570 [Chamaesiphon sp.]
MQKKEFFPLIHCPNSDCSNPLNPLSHKFCESCQTPLVHRYLWAASPAGEEITVGTLVHDRYQVIAPQIWLDTRPHLTPPTPDPLPRAIVPYLRLYPQRLHIPEVYGMLGANSTTAEILLLKNVPVDATGNLLPSINSAWTEASPVCQVYWLWQILQLYQLLAELNVVSSLFVSENLRVEGLGDSWASWFREAQMPVSKQLQEIYQQLQAEDSSLNTLTTSQTLGSITRKLNELLLEQSVQLP